MSKPNTSLFGFFVVLALYSVWYLSGVASVPFHPDESTYLFMSNELTVSLQNPGSQAWQSQPVDPLRQQYRLLNPPLIHHILAIGRWIAGQPALNADWDWRLSWDENVSAGALPSQGLLMAGRMAAAALLPVSLLLMFLSVRRISGDFAAWVAVGLLATNALVLLHTRRAMTEGPMLFGLMLCMWVFTKMRLNRVTRRSGSRRNYWTGCVYQAYSRCPCAGGITKSQPGTRSTALAATLAECGDFWSRIYYDVPSSQPCHVESAR